MSKTLSPGAHKNEELALGTRDRLLQAAIGLFSSSTFDAVSTRDIERVAGVNRGVAAYHFGSKDELWRGAVSLLMDEFRVEFTQYERVMRDVSPPERLRVMLKTCVRFAARRPEFFRMTMLHGADRSERTEWLVAEHLGPTFQAFRDVAGTSVDMGPEEDAMQFFVFIGAASAAFAAPALSEFLFGVSPTDPAFVERFAELVANLGFLSPRPLGLPAALDQLSPVE